MQVQQLSELNVGSVKQLDANNSAKSEPSGVSNTQQKNRFDDHLNKQIDQSKKAKNQENNIEKQKDREVVVDDGDVSKETEISTDEASAEQVEMIEVGKDKLVSVEKTSTTSDIISKQISTEETLPAVENASADLPVAGNTLPLSGVSESALQGVKTDEIEVTIQPPAQSPVETIATDEVMKQTLLQTVELTSAIAKAQVTGNSEAASSSPVAYKAVNITDRLNLQPAQQMPIASEMPAAEVITQTTRLQQVPISTEVNSGLTTTQNMNAVASTVLSEINTTVNSTVTNNAFGNTLSSTITTNMQNPQWSQKMTEQVSFMLKGGFQKAEIKLNPAHLGPMEIKLAINDDQASVNFVAHHAPVRDVIDSAIPRLREMLEQQGLNLADVDVSTKSQQQNEDGTGESNSAGSVEEDMEISDNQADGDEITLNMEVKSGVSIFA